MEDPDEYYQNRADYRDVSDCKCGGVAHFNRVLNRWICERICESDEESKE